MVFNGFSMVLRCAMHMIDPSIHLSCVDSFKLQVHFCIPTMHAKAARHWPTMTGSVYALCSLATPACARAGYYVNDCCTPLLRSTGLPTDPQFIEQAVPHNHAHPKLRSIRYDVGAPNLSLALSLSLYIYIWLSLSLSLLFSLSFFLPFFLSLCLSFFLSFFLSFSLFFFLSLSLSLSLSLAQFLSPQNIPGSHALVDIISNISYTRTHTFSPNIRRFLKVP